MADNPSIAKAQDIVPLEALKLERGKRLAQFPWWFLTMILIAIWTAFTIYAKDNYREAFGRIIIGLGTTIVTSLVAYAIALVLGLLAGLGRISRSVVLNNLATLYVELVRGIPMLVLIFWNWAYPFQTR